MDIKQIINNMEAMHKMCKAVVYSEKDVMEATKDDENRIIYNIALARHDTFVFFREWLQDLIETYYKDEASWNESLKILQMQDPKSKIVEGGE